MAKKGGGGGGKKSSFWDTPFGGMFYFNGDGKEDWGEQWIAFKIFEECTKEEKTQHDYSSDYIYHSVLDDDDDDTVDTSWRDFCEDGSEFDIDPEDYETEEEYEEALAEAKEKVAWRDTCEDGSDVLIDPEDYETEDEYNEALAEARNAWRYTADDGSDYGLDPDDFETEDEYNEALEEAQSNEFAGTSAPAVSLQFSVECPALDKLEEIKEEIGTAANIDEQIKAIANYLEYNYSYNMMPGTTPRGEDFALYFLKEQKSGYCSHFATAATLLLRSYGIPARYVEGYAVSFRNVSEGEETNENYDEWFQGENPLGKTGVVKVNVTDASAHAWVEVYKLGIGWVPYEFTPPSDSADNETAYSDFWGLFSGLFLSSPPDTVEATTEQQNQSSVFQDLFASSSYLAKPLLLFMGFVALSILLFAIVRKLALHLRMQHAYASGDYAPLLSHHYRKLCRKLHRQGLLPENYLLPRDLPCKDAACEMHIKLLEKCCYSQHSISRQEADNLLRFLKSYKI